MFFGILGWKPYEYYCSSPYEVFAASEGYFDKVEFDSSQMRLASYRIHQSLVSKPVSIEEYWPLRSDNKKVEEQEKIVMDPDFLTELKRIHKL